jgi:hypothetical protein
VASKEEAARPTHVVSESAAKRRWLSCMPWRAQAWRQPTMKRAVSERTASSAKIPPSPRPAPPAACYCSSICCMHEG